MKQRTKQPKKHPPSRFEPLERLDLTKCRTVSDVVKGMRKCSFGARMLGEVAGTLTEWVQSPYKPVIIYDGKPGTPLSRLLHEMVKRGWFQGSLTPEEYVHFTGRSPNILVVGLYSERYEEALYRKPERAIFINDFGLAKPGQIRDGFFPDAVFADPRFVIPVLNEVLEDQFFNPYSTIPMLMNQLAHFGGLADEVSYGAAVLLRMIRDKDCTRFLTLSGALTIAKMGLVLCEMVDRGWFQAVTSTGALMAHGLIESVGLKHYKYDPRMSDVELARRKLNRVTDTLEPETNFTHIDEIMHEVLSGLDERHYLTPSMLHRCIGNYLVNRYPKERGILKSAAEKDVPVFVPAFVDSEIGNDVYVHNEWRIGQNRGQLLMNLEENSRELVEMAVHAKRMGIFSIGGGVPRNNVQNVAPLIEIINGRLKRKLPERQFSYGCRIAPDELWYGHLSGCTYHENMSWRKMDPRGHFAEIHGDATMILPFLVRYLMDMEV